MKGLHLLALTLCFQGCVLPNNTPENISIIEETPSPTHIYIQEKDPYRYIGSINYAETEALIGSGVLISPNVVLTAAHVVHDKGDVSYIETDGDVYCIEKIIYYPTYNSETLTHDIAILILDRDSDETPVDLYNKESDLLYKKMRLTTIGYGTGKKRYSKYGLFWYYGRLIKNPQYMIMLPLKGTMWFGDSGGAVITSEGKLIGIMSYFSATREGLIYENSCCSIEFYKEWIHIENLQCF